VLEVFLTLPVLAGFALACMAPALHRATPRFARGAVVAVPLGLAGVLLAVAASIGRGGAAPTVELPWVPPLGVSFALRGDALAILFALIVTTVGALVLGYAGGYLRGHPQLGRLYALLLFFMTAMLGLVLADDLLLLFVFWELTTLASYFLVGFDHERRAARAAALRALLVTALGGLALLAGLLVLGGIGGTYRISELLLLRHELAGHPLLPTAAALILVGAITKSAQVPFHGWLPGAMEAPAPVSAYLHAAAMVKAGVYLLARLAPLLSLVPSFRPALLVVGGASVLLGTVRGLAERDLKRVLAWSTVSALGTLVFLLGVGSTAAVVAALVFLVAHSLYKGALFLAAGAVDHETGVRDVDRLGRLAAAMPRTAAAAILAAASMAGMPLFLGFPAKEAAYGAVLAAEAPLLAVLLFGSAGFLAHAVLAAGRPFLWGTLDRGLHARDPSPSLWVPTLLLAAAGFVLGVWPGALNGLIARAAGEVLTGGGTAPVHLTAWHGVGEALVVSGVGALLGGAAYAARVTVRRASARLEGPAVHARALDALARVARGQTRFLQTGYLRRYLLVIVTVVVSLVGYGLLARTGGRGAPPAGSALVHEIIVAALVLMAAFVAIRSGSRLGSIAALGIVGYGVALLFLFFGAPDLAMTQFVVETLTVILLVLAFHRLPRFSAMSSWRGRARDGVVAVAFGTVMSVLVLAASGVEHARTSADAMIERSVGEAHGRNVVNVILVDFRALDTLGEITVLSVAAFGVVALLRLRDQGEARP
jgi:multicomponent Na+:H+ antiporter subunit A